MAFLWCLFRGTRNSCNCSIGIANEKNANNPPENYTFAKKSPDGTEYFSDG